MDPLNISTFGGLRIELGEAPVDRFETRKAEALLVYLACNRRGYSREMLANLLWDERSQKQTLSNLRVVLTKLRKPLKPYLLIKRETVVLNPDAPVFLDAAEFETCLNRALTNDGESDALSDAEAREIEHALDLYQGEFLEGFYVRESRGFEAWLVQERERLRRYAITALHSLVRHSLESKAYSNGIAHARRLIAMDPFNEPAYQQIIRLLAHSGRRSEALAQFEVCRRMLWDEFEVEPAPETMALVEKVRSGEIGIPAPKEDLSAGEPGADVSNPYKGLQAFGEADVDNFFGREALIERLLDRMSEKDEAAQFLALVGPSGCGKSSLAKAGLIPALRRGRLPKSEKWVIVEMVPGSHPFEELEVGLLNSPSLPPHDLKEQLRRDERSLVRSARLTLPSDESELLLLIDQFEELFIQVQDKVEVRQFLESLYTAVTDPRSRVRIVITLRADFFDRPFIDPGLSKLIRSRIEVVVPLTVDELERAIRAPAERAGLAVEQGLVTAIVADMVEQPGALPLLQFALTEIFERRTGPWLTLQDYRSIGGLKGVLDQRAEETFARLSEAGKTAARHVFLRLANLGEESGVDGPAAADTRRRVLRAELEAMRLKSLPASPGFKKQEDEDSTSPVPESAHIITEVIDAFGEARLLTFDRNPFTHKASVEISHEALLSEWQRLRIWFEEARADVHTQRALASADFGWINAGHDPSFLLYGARLSHLESWAEQTDLALTTEERAFLDASLVERKTQQAALEARLRREAFLEKRSRNFLRLLVIVLLISTIGASALAGIACQSQNIAAVEAQTRAAAESVALAQEKLAKEQARLAVARELVLASNLQRLSDPELGIMLALQSMQTANTKQGEEALRQALHTSRVKLTIQGVPGGSFFDFNPDGTRMVAAYGGVVKVWDTASGQEMLSVPIDDSGDSNPPITFSPNGRHLAVGNADGYLLVLEADTGGIMLSIPAGSPDHWFSGVVYSPDGKLLATANSDSTIRVWDADTGTQLFLLQAPAGNFSGGNGLAFINGSNQLLIYDAVQNNRIIDLATGQEISKLASNDLGFSSLSPDGAYLATLNPPTDETRVDVWDLKTFQEDTAGTPLFSLRGHDGWIWTIDYSHDGMFLASGGQDTTIKIWRISEGRGQEYLTLRGHSGDVAWLRFSPDGNTLASSGSDGNIRLWDISPSGSREVFTLAEHQGEIRNIAYSPDNSRLATAGVDGKVMIWDGETGKLIHTLSHGKGKINTVAFSPDSRQLASSGEDFSVRIWDVETGLQLMRLDAHEDIQGEEVDYKVGGVYEGVIPVIYSPDGRLLASAGEDGTARIWDSQNGDLLQTLIIHPDGNGGTNVKFSPDGSRLATSTESTGPKKILRGVPEAHVTIWDMSGGRKMMTLEIPERIWGLDFSPDGSLLATSGTNGYIMIWDAYTGTELFTLPGHSGTVKSLAFSPDGTRLVTAANELTRVWDLATREVLTTLPGHSGGVSGVVFNSNGTRLATSSRDGTARVYTLDTSELMSIAYQRLTRWLTPDECRQFLHQEECPPQPSAP